MFRNYIKTAWRNLRRNRAFSFINIVGLTIGVTTCLMISLFIMNEFSFDRFHVKGDRIYRVQREFKNEGKDASVAWLSGPYAKSLQTDFAGEIVHAVRVQPNDHLVTIGDRSFHETRTYDVDSNFLSFFTFPLLAGNPASALNNPGSVVLTETSAKKYFGSVSAAMGQTIKLDKQLLLRVTGVAKDVPSNSHLDFDLLIPIANYTKDPNAGFDVWINNRLFTYVELDPAATTPERVQARFPRFVEKHMSEDMRKFAMKFSLSLTPLKDVYFQNIVFGAGRTGDKKVVLIFLSIAILILLIACINFTNLSTIRAVDRSREVGMRKVMGAMRNHLAWQFVGESVLLTLISCVLALGLLTIVMPWYSGLLGYTLNVPWTSPSLWLTLITIILVAGFLAGSYPALVLSGFSPIEALKGKLKLGKGGTRFREALVVFQFAISVFLIIGTIVIMRQMHYVKHRQPGYDQEQSVMIAVDNGDIYKNRNLFRKTLQREPGIVASAGMSGVPGGFFDMHTFDVEGRQEKFIARTEFADFEFVKTLGLKIVAGRDFSPAYPSDTARAVLINQTAASKLGWTPDQAIGKSIRNSIRDSVPRKVVGVVQDFNFLSLKENMDALIISPDDDRRVLLVRLAPGDITAGLDKIKAAYTLAAPQYPFEYQFLDQQFDRIYRKDLRQQTILTIFSTLAIFIACLGLFGLASFAAIKRTREIGIRKTVGASTQSIVTLLARDMLRPVLIAIFIAMPAGYWAMNTWMQQFAYKAGIQWWIFVLAAAVTVMIAIATVSFNSVKAALTNPIKSLRTE